MKRLLAFLLLLALGIVALRLAIGTDDAVRANVDDTTPRPEGPATAGLSAQQGKIGASVSQTGPIAFPQFRAVPVGDGTTRHEQVFRLEAKDSKPISDSLQQLDGVEVLLFEKGKAAARLLARQAFVELARDGTGKPSLREQKDIDLRDAVFETLPGSRGAGMRLELGNARVHVGEHELVLDTATDTEPVRLVVDGERTGTMRGKGLQARVPRDRDSALQRVDVEILHEPELETAGIVVVAKGRMHYVEDLKTGAAQVTLDDDVRVDLTQGRLVLPGALAPAGGGSAGRSEIRGDQFVGWLQREKRSENGRERENVAWRQLLLTGAPAVVAVGSDRLETPRIKVLPGPLGDPFLVSALGGASSIEWHRARPGGPAEGPTRGTSPRRIHMLSPGNAAGALHRQLGFPQWTLGALNAVQIVVFEGGAHVENANTVVTTGNGMQLYSRGGSERGVALGFGDVRLVRRATRPGESDLVVTGNDGFRASFGGEVEHWRLGPPLPPVAERASPRWQAHRYEVRLGNATAQGTGACAIERLGARSTVRLFAPTPSIAGRLPAQGVELASLVHLQATFVDDEVVALDAAGLPARATRTSAGDVVAAVAPRLLQIGPRSLRLLGPEADDPDGIWLDLVRENARPILVRNVAAVGRKPAMQVQVEGPQIDAHHFGFADVMVEAVEVGDWRPTVEAMWDGADGARPTTASFEAARLRALPFAMTREARLLHAGGTVGPVAVLPYHSSGNPWLLADDVSRFRLDDARHGIVTGKGRQLVLSQGAEAALFVGDPDRQAPAEVERDHEGRVAVVRGARVRVFRDQALRLQALRTFADRPTFLLPSLTLHDPRSPGLLAHMTASCLGNIDVLPDSVVFDGPVATHSLLADGTEDASGMHIDARVLRMLRNVDSGEVVRVHGDDVKLDWSKARAHSAEVEIDLRWSKLIARDANGATVVLPDGRTYAAPRIELNYDTMAVTSWSGSLVQGGRPEAAPK